MSDSDAKAAAALMTWYEAMGVDEAIGDAPVDRFALSALKPAPETPPVPAPAGESSGPLTSVPRRTLPPRAAKPATPPKAARSTPAPVSAPVPNLDTIASLAELAETIAAFDGCALKRTAKNTCVSRGSESAKLMLIGEAPGRDEDLQGKPFVGRAGKLLDKMLAAIGLDEESVYITNTIYWRPPGNRTPTPQEITSCMPFLTRQIELLEPEIVVLLGGAAAKSVFQTTEGIMRLRGKWKLYQSKGRDIPALATLHPAYLLRTPEAKRQAWRDLLMIKERLNA